MIKFPNLVGILLLTSGLNGFALPVLAADDSKALIGQGLTFCVDTLTTQNAEFEKLQSRGFEIESKSETRAIAFKSSEDMQVVIRLQNLKNCTVDVSPQEYGEDARASTLSAIMAWAKSKKALFIPTGNGNADLMTSSLNFKVKLITTRNRGRDSATVSLRRQK